MVYTQTRKSELFFNFARRRCFIPRKGCWRAPLIYKRPSLHGIRSGDEDCYRLRARPKRLECWDYGVSEDWPLSSSIIPWEGRHKILMPYFLNQKISVFSKNNSRIYISRKFKLMIVHHCFEREFWDPRSKNIGLSCQNFASWHCKFINFLRIGSTGLTPSPEDSARVQMSTKQSACRAKGLLD